MSDFDFRDFYDEPSEFEIQIEEFKESLMLSIKTEYKEEMERLKKENARLQDIKDNWDKKVSELENEKLNLKIAKINAESNAKKARLRDLLDSFTKQAWGIKYSFDYIREKCDKCDNDGYIHFKSPQGHDVKEKCNCRKMISRYRPIEAEIVEFYGKNNITIVFSYESKSICDNDGYIKTSNVYNGEDFEKLSPFSRIIFYNKDDCQRYCDYLNEKEVANCE